MYLWGQSRCTYGVYLGIRSLYVIRKEVIISKCQLLKRIFVVNFNQIWLEIDYSKLREIANCAPNELLR